MPWKGGIKRQLGLSNPNKARSRSPRPTAAQSRGAEPDGGCASSSSVGQRVTKEGFKEVLGKYFLTNVLSARQAHELASSSVASSALGVDALSKAGAHGKHPGNMCRDLLRTLLQGCSWPEPYWAQVLVRDKGSGTDTLVDFPVLLPHEFFDNLVKANKEKLELFKASVDHAPELLPLVQEFAFAFGVDAAKVIPLGLHGDGVPFAAKMTDSLEQLSWNFCAQPASQRILFTAIPKSAVAGRGTWDALLGVFSWSMRQLALGVWPSLRHDGNPWGPKDSSRASKGGRAVPDAGRVGSV